jgi:hypothetical protein
MGWAKTDCMPPRYIAARRAPGRPSRHLTARRLRRMESRFYRALWTATTVLGAAVYLVW